MPFFIKVLVSSLVIAVSTEIAKRNPSLGGLILALPLTSVIAFAFMGYQGTSVGELSSYAKSTLIFVPISLIFFLPFVISPLQEWSFLAKFLTGLFSLTLVNVLMMKLKVL